MAIVTMQHLRLIAMKEDREQMLSVLQCMGCIEVMESAAYTPDECRSLEDSVTLNETRWRKQIYETALAALAQYAPEKSGLVRQRIPVSESALFGQEQEDKAIEDATYINTMQREITALEAQAGRLDTLRETLRPWMGLHSSLDLEASKDVSYQIGTIGINITEEERDAALAPLDGLAVLTETGSDRHLRYCLLICHNSVFAETMEALRTLGWTRAIFHNLRGTPSENITRIGQELEQLRGEIEQKKQSIAAMVSSRAALRLAEDRARIEIQRGEAREKLAKTGSAFFLEGWIPKVRGDELRQKLSSYDCSLTLEDPPEEEYGNVPVQLAGNALTRPLNMVTEMYSLPAYGTLDPNPLMAPFFILFYGIMMADMGYGLLMMLTALIVKRRYTLSGTMDHFFGLMGLCGISTFVMGAMIGGFFGDFLTQLVALISPGTVFAFPKLFDPLDDIMLILIGSLCLGLVQILTGMLIGFIEKIKRGKWMDAIFEELTWWIVFAGIAAAVLRGRMFLLALGGTMIVMGSLAQNQGMGKLTGIVGSLYNHVTGYFGDILSYSRLMALMLAGSVIAQVFNMLATLPGNIILFVIISLLGNALNFGLNLLGCYVHDLRLQCLEYFGKFYVDGGRPFRPLTMDGKYVRVETE